MHNILDEIVENKKIEIAKSKSILSLDDLKDTLTPGNGSFVHSLRKPGINIIAEIKPKSPSAGVLSENFCLDNILPAYNQYACALSVLTDAKYFSGSFELLSTVSEKSSLPILCKDFIVDPYQIYLARRSGAQAVLLIVKILNDKDLTLLYLLTKQLGMAAVLEIQNEAELTRLHTLNLQSEVLLINNRNLEDFTIDQSTTKKLAPRISSQAIVISASGIESKQDIENLKQFCSNFLVGSLFMRSADPKSEFQNLLANEPLASLARTDIRLKGNNL